MIRRRSVGAAIAVALFLLIPRSDADTEKGIQLYRSKQYTDAERELQQSVEASPEDTQARYYLGLTLLELGKYDDAKTQFEALSKPQETSPTPAEVQVGLGRAYMNLKEYGQAQASLDKALKDNPDSSDVHLYRGKLDVMQKKYAVATKELDKAIALDPKNAYAYYYGGIAYSNIGRFDKMADYFQYFLKLAPDAPEAKKVKSLLRSVR
jgi:tetratricopeptide (TPR) repeat protein